MRCSRCERPADVVSCLSCLLAVALLGGTGSGVGDDNVASTNRGLVLVDCRGDPAWSTFREQLRIVTKHGRLELQPEIVEFAMMLVQSLEQGDSALGIAGGVEMFYQDLCNDVTESFCLYGVVSAYFVVAADLHRAAASGDNEARGRSQGYLMTAIRLLGLQHCLDFMESSSWPIRSDDLLININCSTKLQFRLASDTSIESSSLQPPFPPPAGSSLHGWRSLELAHSLRSTISCPSGDGPLRIAAIGTHPTLTMEAIVMLREFAFQDEQKVEVVYTMGINYKCTVFPEMCVGIASSSTSGSADPGGASAVGSMVEDPIAKLIGAFEAPPPYEDFTFDRISRALEDVGDLFLRDGIDLLVCTSPFVICALLQRITELPLLAYLGLPLLWKRPSDHFDNATAHTEFWSLLAKLADNPRVVMAANNPLLSEQIAFQSPGLLLRVVRPHAVFTRATYAPAHASEALLISRTKFLWVTLGCLIQRFTPKGYPIQFVVMNTDSKMPFADLASYRAAVIAPWEHALMAFFEFYSMAVPLLMPDAPWAYRLLFDDEGNLGSTGRDYADISPACDGDVTTFGCSDPARRHPFPPFAFASLQSRRYWYQYSFLVQWPHVHRFTSVAQMLELLLVADLSRTSAFMKEFNDRTLVQSVAFWRQSAGKLLDGGKRNCRFAAAARPEK